MFPRDYYGWHSGKGHWTDVSDEEWNNEAANEKPALIHFDFQHMVLSKEEKDGLEYAKNRLSVSVTPYFFNLINLNDLNCPIRRQVIPVN